MLENSPNASEATPQSSQKALLTTSEAAAYLGLAISTLNKWRCFGEGPQFIKLGRAVRYRQDALKCYVEISTRNSTNPTRAHSKGDNLGV